MTTEPGPDLDFSTQTALVTGTTRGIGEAIAAALAARGATLLLTGTDPDDIARRNAAAPPGRRYLCADFASAKGLEAFLDQLAAIDRIDVCINNAGINRVDAVDEIDPADWDAVANVNLRAPALITGVVARTMKRHGYGRIVNVSSIWGHRVWEKRATYASTKWGLRGLTAASAKDLAAHGILVNTVSPGFTDTALVRGNYSAEELASVVNRIPLGRLARTDEIATAVLFLASRGNSYITGQSLVVDGGYGLG
jgi:3-oxoacyl-[acyl-carrier protein] reductase